MDKKKSLSGLCNQNNTFLKSILKKAKLDVRIDNHLYNREDIINILSKNNIQAYKSLKSDIGITIEKRIPENLFNKIKKNYFEIQDEGSQIMSLMVGAKKGENILDYCAGKGTKSLTLYNQINKHKGLYVYEKNLARLDLLIKRISKVKASNIKVIYDFSRFKDFFDKIVVDVPCSGSGVWRRKPENMIYLNKADLKEHIISQGKILDNVVKYCKNNGLIIYITCSILREENEGQIKRFLLKHKNFKTVNLKKVLEEKFKFKLKEKNIKWFTLYPNKLISDGYFICIMKKKTF